MTTLSSLYSLKVAPVIVLPLSKVPFFTYAATEKVPIGSLISISFGKQEIEGVVFGCQKLSGNKPSWIKNITHIKKASFLTAKQLELAECISEEYFTPLGNTIKHFLPKIAKTTKKRVGDLREITLEKPTKEESALLKKFSLALEKSLCYLDTTTLDDAKRFYTLLAHKTADVKKQTLVIVPEITMLPSLIEKFSTSFKPGCIAILGSHVSTGLFFNAWERIRSGEAEVILATRQGLFAPFHNLGTIIVTEEQDDSYKQWDMSPRYHSKRVAEMLGNIHDAKILFASNTPSIESIFHIDAQNYMPLRPLANHGALGGNITIVNLKLERFRKNYSPLSETLVEYMRNTLTQKDQALLYINHQGMNTFSVCDNCKSIFRCLKCGHPLTSTREGYFRCLSCSYKTNLFPNCPTCGHLSFKHRGFGTEKIEKEAIRLFPSSAIVRADGTTMRKGNTAQILYKKGASGKIDILVGTQMILKDPPLSKLSLIAMIDADSLLFFPDFRADERLFQHLSRAVHQVATKKGTRHSSGHVIIQTFHPESAFLQRVSSMDADTFREHILKERKELFYPPFSRLVALSCQDKTEAGTKKKATTLFLSLKKALPTSFRTYPPQMAQFLKRKNLFESTLFLRIPASKKIPTKLHSFLISISKDCIIDVDPISFR